MTGLFLIPDICNRTCSLLRLHLIDYNRIVEFAFKVTAA